MQKSTRKKSKQARAAPGNSSRQGRVVGECEEKYGNIVEVMGDIIYKIDPNGLFLYLNNSVANLGYEPKELIGRHFSTIIHPQDIENVSRQLVLPKFKGKKTGPEHAPKLFDERRSESRMTKNLELRLITKNWHTSKDDSTCRFCSLVSVGEVSASGQYRQSKASKEAIFTGTVGLIRDITNHKESERALQMSERKYRELTDFLPIPIFEIDLNGMVTFANKIFFEMFQYAREDLESGVNILDCLALQDRKKASENIKRKINGENFSSTQYTALRKDGTTFPVILESSCVREGQTVLGLRGAVLDISELKKTEQSLRDSERKMEQERFKIEKQESISVVAGGIAHDFNNFLTSILGNVTLAKTTAPPAGEFCSILEDTERILIQAAGLNQQLLTFAKNGALATEICSITHLIKDSTLFVLRGTNITTHFSIADDLWAALVDKAQIGQVISNLVINAKQAMPSGGAILVDAHNKVIDSESTENLQPGRYICIRIRDQGPGIPKDHLSRIFDPYFTTKQKGSGLGLALCYSIIRKHKGHIAVETEEGKGTTFSLFLPASDEETQPDDSLSETELLYGEGKILLMDDTEIIRESVGRMISSLGYDVELVTEGSEAIESFIEAKEGGIPYNVIILDLTVLGGMGGKETMEKLMEIDPSVKAIASSGYSNNPVMTDYSSYGFRAAVNKPYTITKLSRILHDLITE
jgi:PAS domain S-box-containing protein